MIEIFDSGPELSDKKCNTMQLIVLGSLLENAYISLNLMEIRQVTSTQNMSHFIGIYAVCTFSAKEIEIIHRLFLVIAMYCQASSMNH